MDPFLLKSCPMQNFACPIQDLSSDSSGGEVDLFSAVAGNGRVAALRRDVEQGGLQLSRRRAARRGAPQGRAQAAMLARTAKSLMLARRCRKQVKHAVELAYKTGRTHNHIRGQHRLNVHARSFEVSSRKLKGSMQMSIGERLISMFGKMVNDGATALRLGVHERTVRRMRGFGASALQCLQRSLMTSLSSGDGVLDAFAMRLSFDETKHKLAVAPDGCGLLARQSVGMWSVLVQKRRILIMPAGRPSPIYLTLLVPPIFLSSVAAPYLYSALFTHDDFIDRLSEFARELCGRAQFSFLALGCDGAASNDKLVAYLAESVYDDTRRKELGGFGCISATLCGNHRVNLVEAASFLYIDERLHGDLFCTTVFFGASGMFLRFCLASKVLASTADMLRTPPPSCDLPLEFLQFLLDARVSELQHARLMPTRQGAVAETTPDSIDLREWHSLFNKGMSLDEIVSADASRDKALKKYARSLLELIAIFNGDISVDKWHHHCCSPSCCSGTAGPHDVSIMRRRMVDSVLKVVLATLPTTPQKGKWTKTWPCVVWFLRAMGVHNMFSQALRITSEHHRQPQVAPSVGDDVVSGMDIDFARIKGIRRQRAEKFASNPSVRFNVSLVCVVLEPLRFLCGWFLGASSATFGGRDVMPPAIDLSSVRSSLVFAMMRHFASMLRGTSSRCLLLWAFEERSFEIWASRFPERLGVARRALLGISSWLFLRFNFWMCWPYKLLQVVDRRLEDEVSMGVARQFMAACPKCLDPGCSRRLRSKLGSAEDLMTPLWQRALLAWGHQIPVSIADVEHTHSSNKVVGGQQCPTAGGFACRSFLKDARLLTKCFNQWHSRLHSEQWHQDVLEVPPSRPASLYDSLQRTKRALSAFDVFKKGRSVSGELRGKVGSSGNAALVAEYNRASDAERQHYEELAANTFHIAKRNRASGAISSRSAAAGPSGPGSDGLQLAAIVPIQETAIAPCEGMHHQAIGDVWLQLQSKSSTEHFDNAPVFPHGGVREKCETALPKDVFSPLSHSVLEEYMQKVKSGGGSISSVSKRMHQSFTKFCRAKSELLGKVEYPFTCGALCRDPRVTAPPLTAMRDDFAFFLKKFISILGSPKVFANEEVVMMVRCVGDDGDSPCRFFTIGACLTTSHGEAFVFVESVLVGERVTFSLNCPLPVLSASLAGRRLQVSSTPSPPSICVESLPRHFRPSQATPVFSFFTGGELAVQFVRSAPHSIIVQQVCVTNSGALDVVEICSVGEKGFQLCCAGRSRLLPEDDGGLGEDDGETIDLFSAVRQLASYRDLK